MFQESAGNILVAGDQSKSIDEFSTSSSPPKRSLRLLICFTIFATLVAWASIFRWSGDFDAVGHYLNLRDSWQHPSEALYAWSRPLFVLLLIVPAKFGILPARISMAAIACITAWLTMRLADRLKLPHPTLAAPLLILQPLVFAIAADTMTEIPMALCLAIAIHLWWSRRWAASALLVSFMPLVRPEGFFIAPLWGFMLLNNARIGKIQKRCATCLLLATGICTWSLACKLLTGDCLFFYRNWSWPVEGYAYYPHGTLLHHVFLWPYYCGGVLIILFLAGLKPSWNRLMALPWALFLLVFILHSILFAKGWFASAGLMRIMASTSPVTALICLHGWNRIAQTKWIQRMPHPRQRILAAATLLAALIWAMATYLLYPPNWHTFPLREIAQRIQTNHLRDTAPQFFAADEIIRGELDLPLHSPGVVKNIWDKQAELQLLSTLPPGTLGEWDNQRGLDFFQLDIPDLLSHGYVIIDEIDHPSFRWRPTPRGYTLHLENERYVILRKES